MHVRQEVRNSVGLVNQPPHPFMTTLDWRFKMLTYEEVSELLEYRPEVGGSCLVWKRNAGRAFIGHRAGSAEAAHNAYLKAKATLHAFNPVPR